MPFKRLVIIAVCLFVLGIFAGTLTPPDIKLAQELTSELRELAGVIQPFTFLTLVIIFVKNVMAMLLSFVLSPLLCLVPVLSLFANGWILGFIAGPVIEQKSILFMIAGILPHGIFEIPAMIIAQAAALGFGYTLILALFHKNSRAGLVPRLSHYVKWLALALILLLPAAIIETFLTPLLIGG